MLCCLACCISFIPIRRSVVSFEYLRHCKDQNQLRYKHIISNNYWYLFKFNQPTTTKTYRIIRHTTPNMPSSTTIRTVAIYIPLLTGSLSVLGSGAILYSIWARRDVKLKDPQHRILGAMSFFDVLYSLNKALVFLTYPSGLGVPTFGNVATCSLQGFFTQFGYAAGTITLYWVYTSILQLTEEWKRRSLQKY